MQKEDAEMVWDAFRKAASGWQFSKGSEVLYFTPPTEPEDYHDPVYDDSFEFLLKEGLVGLAESSGKEDLVSLAESSGYVFVIADKGKALYAELIKLDESLHETRFYELVKIEVL